MSTATLKQHDSDLDFSSLLHIHLAFLLCFREQNNSIHQRVLPFSKIILFDVKIQLSKKESFQRFLKGKTHDKHILDVQHFQSN